MGRDDDVAPLKLGEQRATDWTVLDGNGAGHIPLDKRLVQCQTVHVGVALDLTITDSQLLADQHDIRSSSI